MAEVAVAYVTLLPSARGFRSNTERALRPHVSGAGVSLGRTFGSSFGRTASAGLTSNTTGIRSALKSFSVDATRSFTTVTAAASTLVGVLAGIGIRTAASLQQAQVGFETLLGSAKEATAFLGGIRDFAVRTPFEVNALIANARALLGVGVAADGIIPTLKSLGNVTAAFGLNQEQFNGILRAFTQIASKGKVQAEELLQISENGLPAMQLFAKGLGLSVEQLLALTKEGKLTAKVALPALLKQLNKDYAGAMAKQFDTLTGVYNNFKEATKLALADGVKPLIPVLQRVLPQVTAKAKAGIEAASGALKDFISGVRGNMLNDGKVSLFESIGAGAVAAFDRIKAAFAGVRDIIQANSGTISSIVGVIRTQILPAIGSIATSLTQGFQVALLTFFDVLGTVGVPTVRTIAKGLNKIAPALEAIVGFITRNQDFLGPFAAALAAYAISVRAVAVATGAWAAAQVAVNTAMATNPYIAAFGAVVALAGGMVYLNETTGRAHDAFIAAGRVATQITVVIGKLLNLIIRKSLQQIANMLDILEAISNPLGKLTNWKSPFGKAADQLDKAADATKKWDRAIESLPDRIEIPATITVRTVAASSTEGLGLNGKALTPQQAAAQHAKDVIKAAQDAGKKETPKVPPFDFDKLLEQLGLPTGSDADQAAKAAADNVKKVADKAKDALRAARDELKAYAKSVADTIRSFGSVINLTNDNRDVTPSTVAGFLDHQLKAIARFQRNLRILAKRGISDSLLQQIADAGPEEGGQIAAALVQTSKGDFERIQKVDAEINRRAGAIGKLAANRVLGDEVAGKVADVINITVNNPRPERASESVPKALRRTTFSAGGSL